MGTCRPLPSGPDLELIFAGDTDMAVSASPSAQTTSKGTADRAGAAPSTRGTWQTVIVNPVRVANAASSVLNNLVREPLEPPPSALISRPVAVG
jgi:hypothetical protein